MNWEKVSGMGVNFSQASLDAQGPLYFTFSPKGGEFNFLTIHLGPDPVDLGLSVSERKCLTRVSSLADLEMNRWALAFRYRFWKSGFWVVVVALLMLAWVWWKISDERPLEVYEIVNLALRRSAADNSGLWQHVFRRIKYFMQQEFRGFCVAFQKPQAELSSDKLFESLRNFLRYEYGKDNAEFGQQSELDSAIRTWMREIAARV